MTTAPALRVTTRRRADSDLSALAAIAVDLTANLTAADRYERLVDALHRFLPCDALTLLRFDGTALTPVAARGLALEAMARRFEPAEHPRLAQILRAPGPVRFDGSRLPDPFDGLLVDPDGLGPIHSCVGSPLTVAGDLIGVLCIDTLKPSAFDHVTDEQMATAAALAAACMRTSQFEEAASHSPRVAAQLDARARSHDDLVGASAPIRALRHEVALCARTDLPVLISGETGVGKEVVARAIHAASARRDRPLILVNCAALPETIAESELFGHLRGSYTGAVDARAGKFEVADGGTLFLDEIGELPLALQAKLLRAVQSGEIQRVGADHPIHVDVRLIAATNRDLPIEVSAGRFRNDLFHRLSVLPIEVPPLRTRGDDVAILAGYFVDESRRRLDLGPISLTASARLALAGHDWPGNVRELEHVLLRAALRAAGPGRGQPVVIDVEHLALPRRTIMANAGEDSAPLMMPLADAVDEFKRRQIRRAVHACGGNWAKAARMLGLDRGNLHRTAERLGMLGS